MAYPRASALAETLWTPPERRNYGDFLERLAAHRARFAVQGVRARPRP
jgi:hexosaminidase